MGTDHLIHVLSPLSLLKGKGIDTWIDIWCDSTISKCLILEKSSQIFIISNSKFYIPWHNYTFVFIFTYKKVIKLNWGVVYLHIYPAISNTSVHKYSITAAIKTGPPDPTRNFTL